jgi:hypothetical protein
LHPNCSLEIDVIKSGYDMSSEPQIISGIAIFGTDGEDVEYSIDGKEWIKNNSTNDLIDIRIDINHQSKKAEEKWVIVWKTLKTKSCNIE